MRKNWRIAVLAFLGVVFFFIYLYLYLPYPVQYPEHLILNQPDESINYFFIRELAVNNRYVFPEPLSGLALNQVHPRSVTVVNGALTPIGFPGLIAIFGLILRVFIGIFGSRAFNFWAVGLTPFLAALAPLIFFGVLKRIFDEKLAFVSALFLFILPPWWYYASRPFQHNTLFIFLVIVALYCYVIASPSPFPSRKSPVPDFGGIRRLAFSFFTGLFFGLAVYVRPSEIVWLAVLGLVGLFYSRRRWVGKQYLSLAAGLGLTAILFCCTQIVFYGHILGSGYVKPDAAGFSGSIFSGPQGISIFKAIFLPFGFHPLIILKNIKGYFFDLFGGWTVLEVLGWGLLFVGWRKKDPQISTNIVKYLFLYLFVSLHLLIFYGSWLFYDNLLAVPSIGTSYARYFLPIYVFGLPLAVYLLLSFWSSKKLTAKIFVVLVGLSLLLSSHLAVFNNLEGLALIKETVRQYQDWRSKIYKITELGAVIVTRYGDKYIFPGRRVIPGWKEKDQIKAIGRLIKAGHQLYFYDLRLDKAEEKELQLRLVEEGAVLGAVEESWSNLEVRKIIKK